MKLRAPLEEVQQRPSCQRLDAEKDDLSVTFIEAQYLYRLTGPYWQLFKSLICVGYQILGI